MNEDTPRPTDDEATRLAAVPDVDAGAARRRALGAAIRTRRSPETQAQLAVRLGIPQTTLSRWENGVTSMSLEQVHGAEVVMGLPAGTLAVDAGYIDPAAQGDPLEDADENPLAGQVYIDLDDAIAGVRAADTLGLGWRLEPFLRFVNASDGVEEFDVSWALELFPDAPID